jgi:hypothetical protein
MKKSRSYSHDHPVRKVACTVSAAALMLGVSQAATVGLHFQVNYCLDSRYTGFPVTMTAFGIGTNAWENLTKMDTGYGCSGGSGPYTLSQVVDTTTSTDGLNPLPNGSLSITWSADTANFSGFGGYGVNTPSHGYGGAPPVPIPTGEWQIYSSFFRDGVNFGPQPGDSYSVDITGLKTLFTNTPFAVQLIAASDSMQYLTNAFVIDATANTTQSVIYPSTPPVADVGDTSWIRGHGGGLSTGTGALNTDHLKIIGNRAAHGGDKTTGTNFASTISGFIITDKPVISMSPRQVLVCGGDTVSWSGYAVGVPPLAYQWRKNGVPIPGATNSAYSLTNVGPANVGSYDLGVTNLYGAAFSSPVTVGDEILTSRMDNLVVDSNPNGPQHNGLNHGAIWLASSTDGGGVTRTGVMSFSTNAPSQITVAGETNFDSSAGTTMFWMRSSGLADPSGNPATLFDRLTGNGGATGSGNGIVIAQNSDGSVELQIGSGTSLLTTIPTMAKTLSNNLWHQVAVVYDQSGSTATAIYIDGQLDAPGIPLSGWSWQVGQELELGLSHDTNSWQAYIGLMDDVRFYNRALTSSEITSAYGGALVDPTALVMRLNFTTAPGPGINLTWQCTDAILQSADSVNGPYTDVPGAVSPYSIGVQTAAKFYRYRGHTPVVVISNPYLM